MAAATAKPPSKAANRRISYEALLAQIRAIHTEVRGEYGWPKIWKEVVARFIRVGKERVRRTTQERGIKASGKRKFVVTTDSKHNLPITPNLLQRTSESSLVTYAPRMACFRRASAPGLVFHSDRGSQCCRHEFQLELKSYKMKSSMSHKGE